MALDKVVDSAKLDGALTATADSIRAKTDDSAKIAFDLDNGTGFKAAVEAIQTGGGENPMDYVTDLSNAFEGVNFGGEKEFEISFGGKTGMQIRSVCLNQTFRYYSGLKSITLDYQGATPAKTSMIAFARQLYRTYTLERVVFAGALSVIGAIDCNNAFFNNAGLREIIGEFDASGTTNPVYFSNMFVGCEALETIRFTAGTIEVDISFSDSPNLTDETIQSILDGLADLTGGTAQTLTLHATVGAKLTDEQKATASAKNWTLAY